MADNGRGLFQIRVINLDTDNIIHSEEVIAEGESDALFQSNLKDVLKNNRLTRDDVHIIIKEFGSVPKRDKIKTVKVLGGLLHKHEKEN